jgi:MoxR-like ATPase
MKKRIKELLFQLNEGVFERNEVIALALLSAVAGESIFLLGPPGVAKSLVARKLKHAFKDGSSFEYLMSRFSTPDEIFGPVSISKLKDQDKYERIVENYLPSATVVFLDEIWKAGPSIQNALLTVVNEKIFRNGDKEIKIPMKALISASNELPAKGEGLEALWDRFLVRVITTGIKDKKRFNEMISDKTKSKDYIEDRLKISNEEYEKWSKEIDKVTVTNDVFEVIHAIRKYIDEYNLSNTELYISDRRWKKIVRLLKASAFFNERTEVDVMDCLLIKHCIWNDPEHIEPAKKFVEQSIKKYGHVAMVSAYQIRKDILDFEQEVKRTSVVTQTKQANQLYIKDNCYYLVGYPNKARIPVATYNKLTQQDQYISIEMTEGVVTREWGPLPARINKPNHIVFDHNEYALQMVQGTQSVQQIKPPTLLFQK